MLDLFNDFVALISEYLIRGIFISVLVVWISARIFNKLDTQTAKTILRWIMIEYACLAIVSVIITILCEFYNGVEFVGYAFGDRAFGEYWFSFWLILICNTVLPFILLSKKINTKWIFIFLVAVVMNIGWLFESFVIHVTNIHRDYIPNDWEMIGPNQFLPYWHEIKFLLSGLILGIVVLGVDNLIKRFKKFKREQ